MLDLEARLARSIDLATGQIERAGRHGRSIGPYVCATVELRIDDLRAAAALVREVERLRAALLGVTQNTDRATDAHEIARAALEGE